MSKTGKKLIHPTRNTYKDRQSTENEAFPALTVRLERIESMLLLLDTAEDLVLESILKHICDYVQKSQDNVEMLKQAKLLDLLLRKELFRLSKSLMVRRFALYLTAHIVENLNILVDLESPDVLKICAICLEYYVRESDYVCLENLSVIINELMRDPKVVKYVSADVSFLNTLYRLTSISDDPDIIMVSLKMLEKLLFTPSLDEVQKIMCHPWFPIRAIMCGLTSEYMGIRMAALNVVRLLVLNPGVSGPLNQESHKKYVLEQLTKTFCEDAIANERNLVVDVLGTALRHEDMAHLFFECNLFDSYLKHITDDLESLEFCQSLKALSEVAKYSQYLPRLVRADVSDKLLKCFLANDSQPSEHILVGLNRMIKNPQVSNQIVKAYADGVVIKLLGLVKDVAVDLRIREEASALLLNLLTFAYHKTAEDLLKLEVSAALAEIFGQEPQYHSIDLILYLLSLIESVAANVEYREKLCENLRLSENLGKLLMDSFSSAIVINHIFRCLCTIVDEETVRSGLLQSYLASSIKRALKSLSNLVKSSVTNFIMQTSRFPECLGEYIERGVLEVLIFHQKHAFCVPTWNPAIESILSKTPTLKFSIRNHLDFTDLTYGQDFFVSKRKFDDYRIFQAMLIDDVSPLHPVLVVNFERPITPEDRVVRIPKDCLTSAESKASVDWCYCRTPGDACLPCHLEEAKAKMLECGLTLKSPNLKTGIDFENMTKRVQIIAQIVKGALGNDMKSLDLNDSQECSRAAVQCHLKELAKTLHCAFVPLGHVRSGCEFERALLFKTMADQLGVPCTLQRSVDGRILFNEVPLPIQVDYDVHCEPKTLEFMPWRMLRPTHIVDLMYNVGELYPLQSRQAMQYLRLY